MFTDSHRVRTVRTHLLMLAGSLLFWSAGLCVQSTRAQTTSGTASAPTEVAAKLSFAPAEQGTWRFDTGALRGRLRTEQLTFGLHELEYVPTGERLVGGHGLLNVYRVFSDGQRYGGGGWDWPTSSVERREDGSVAIECAADSSRPFVFRGIYRWSDPLTLDLTMEVVPQQDLHDFEVFLASYFAPIFSEARVFVKEDPTTGKPGLLEAKETYGTWLAFPRDEDAVKLIQDGRWTLPPNPVDWVIMPPLQHPLALRREMAGGLTALIMASAQDCFAVNMPHQHEPHYSVYLSFFGRDLAAHATATARARLKFLSAPDDRAIMRAYREFNTQGSFGDQ